MPTPSPYGYDYPDYYMDWIHGGAKHPVWDVEGVNAAAAAGISQYAPGYGDPNGGWTTKETPWHENLNFNAQGQQSSIWNPAYTAYQQNWLATHPFSGNGSQTAPNQGDPGFGVDPNAPPQTPLDDQPAAPPSGTYPSLADKYPAVTQVIQNGAQPDVWQQTILNRSKAHATLDENKKMRQIIRNTVLQQLGSQKSGGRYGSGSGWGGGL